ncbi:MAG TPA: serine hydrolase [Bacteroidota bacterium]|nr:serine hydrolase [Bacteroidota bacterium]
MALRLIVLMLVIQTAVAQQLSDLTADIVGRLSNTEGRFAVGVLDLSSGEILYVNPDTVFHAASTMKTPVMVEVFKQAKAGKFSLDDSIEVKNEFRSIVDGSPYRLNVSDDSDSLVYKRIGSRMSIRDLVFQMITVSSNLATNILIELVGAPNVMETMRSLGARDSKVLRGVEDGKAFRLGLNNVVTARDLVIIYRAIATGSVVDAEACRVMVKILSEQHFRDIIPAQLPAGAVVAHKTGSITGVEHDSGIVYLPNGRSYVIVLLSKDLKDAKAGKRALADVSKRIYDFFMRGS